MQVKIIGDRRGITEGLNRLADALTVDHAVARSFRGQEMHGSQCDINRRYGYLISY
jgi:hypothetical protein